MNQVLQGTELHTILPSSLDAHTCYQFELPSSVTLLFGLMTGFLVRGTFQSKESAAADDSTFAQLTEASSSEVALVPNWFEHLIKGVTVYHDNSAIQTHDVPQKADPYLNTCIYSHMSEAEKGLPVSRTPQSGQMCGSL